VRSARIVELLRKESFPTVFNVRGGIAAWSGEIDASVPTY
jgi:rhodanese-related sulfurtransferase